MTSAAGPETDLPPPYNSVELSSPPYHSDVTLPRYEVSEAPPPYSGKEAYITSSATSNQVTSGCSYPLVEYTNAQVPRNENVAAAETQLHNQLLTTQRNNCRPNVFSVSRNLLPINNTNRNINASKDNNIRTVSRNQGWYSSRQFVNAQERRWRCPESLISARFRTENQNGEPRSYFWLTVCVCVCCCCAVGVFAVLFSRQVKAANAKQDYKKARRCSNLTCYFTVLTMFLGLSIYTYIIFMVYASKL